MRRAGLVLACLAIFPLAGCIILPLPPVGAQIGREEIETLRPGSSTRQDVRATLGGPDQSLTDRYEIFEVDEETMYLFFGTYGFGDIVRIGGQDFRVLAEYGPDDVLQSLAWEARIANDGAGYQYMSSRVDAAALDIRLLAWPCHWSRGRANGTGPLRASLVRSQPHPSNRW